MTVDITYLHINRDMQAQAADGAYCMSGSNSNIFLNFFQEIPWIPKELTLDTGGVDSSDDDSNLLYWETGEGEVKRVFVGKMRMTPQAARQLIQSIQGVLEDMEK